MSNVDQKLVSYRDRLIALETEKREIAESIRDLSKEMKGIGISADEIAGVKLAVRRSFESDEKRAKRETAEEFAAALGAFRDSPLGQAAVDRHG